MRRIKCPHCGKNISSHVFNSTVTDLPANNTVFRIAESYKSKLASYENRISIPFQRGMLVSACVSLVVFVVSHNMVLSFLVFLIVFSFIFYNSSMLPSEEKQSFTQNIDVQIKSDNNTIERILFKNVNIKVFQLFANDCVTIGLSTRYWYKIINDEKLVTNAQSEYALLINQLIKYGLVIKVGGSVGNKLTEKGIKFFEAYKTKGSNKRLLKIIR